MCKKQRGLPTLMSATPFFTPKSIEMTKDLTTSLVERKNVLNNNLAIPEIYNAINFSGIMFEKKYRFTKSQVEYFYEVDHRTIERLLSQNEEELKQNGYEVLTGDRLKHFKQAVVSEPTKEGFTDKDIDNLATSPSLGVFTFKAFLNIGMLLATSEKAKMVRSLILDIIIDVLNKRAGGHTKYINQREEHYLSVALDEFNYRDKFTKAIDLYIEKNNFKYAQLTDKVYKSIFNEKAKEYKKILKLSAKESVRATFYTEVLRVVSDYENSFAKELQRASEKLDRKLTLSEAHHLFNDFAIRAEDMMEASINEARTKMASRDLVFRDALHEKLENYIKEVSEDDFEKFLGEQSMALEKRLQENSDVFKRLKDR